MAGIEKPGRNQIKYIQSRQSVFIPNTQDLLAEEFSVRNQTRHMVTHQNLEPSMIWWVQLEIYDDLGDHETWKPSGCLFRPISSFEYPALSLHRRKESTYKKCTKGFWNAKGRLGRHCLSRNWNHRAEQEGPSESQDIMRINLKENRKAHKCHLHITFLSNACRAVPIEFEARIWLIWAWTNNLKHNKKFKIWTPLTGTCQIVHAKLHFTIPCLVAT